LSSIPVPEAGFANKAPGVLAAPTTSLFQAAVTAIRSLLDVDWTLRRTGAVAIVNSVSW
jgi:hypothetical protein